MKVSRGFTLLEMLVAVAIFAVVSALAYGGLASVTRQFEVTSAAQARLQEIRRAVMLFERDVFQLANRPIREAFQGERLPPLRGGVDQMLPLEMSKHGWRNPAGQPRASIQRVAWELSDGKLFRLNWMVLDQAQDSEPQRLEVLDRVSSIEVRFLNEANDWLEQWPPLDVGARFGEDAAIYQPAQMPRAIEFIIELEDIGRIRRLVELAR